MSARRDRRSAGTSLLELTVAMAVASLVLALAAELLVAAQRQMLRASAASDEASLALVVSRLRADLVAASRIVGPTRDLWDRGALELVSGGRRLRWRLAGEDLVREELTAEDAIVGGATLLREVALWRWREASGGRTLVVVELATRQERRLGAVTGAAGLAATVPTLRSRRLVVTLRGGGGGEW